MQLLTIRRVVSSIGSDGGGVVAGEQCLLQRGSLFVDDSDLDHHDPLIIITAFDNYLSEFVTSGVMSTSHPPHTHPRSTTQSRAASSRTFECQDSADKSGEHRQGR